MAVPSPIDPIRETLKPKVSFDQGCAAAIFFRPQVREVLKSIASSFKKKQSNAVALSLSHGRKRR
jgi:hypothetical protein